MKPYDPNALPLYKRGVDSTWNLEVWPIYGRFVRMTLPWLAHVDWSVTHLAERAGLDRGWLCGTLQGHRTNVETDTVALVAEAIEKELARRGLQMGRCCYCGQAYPLPPGVKAEPREGNEDRRHYGC